MQYEIRSFLHEIGSVESGFWRCNYHNVMRQRARGRKKEGVS